MTPRVDRYGSLTYRSSGFASSLKTQRISVSHTFSFGNSDKISEMISSIPQLTHEQHFVFGYNREGRFHPFAKRATAEDRWTVQYGRAQRFPMSFRQECLETARLIQRQTREPITVLFSGGIDSEVALRSFYEAGIPVTAAILKFKNELNAHDTSWAQVTCDELKIPTKILELDLLSFWQSEDALRYADETQCISPQFLTTMWMLDRCDGYCVLGSGENFLTFRTPTSRTIGWSLVEKEKVATWYRYFIAKNRAGCPGFFQYTPELMLSWMLDPAAVAFWRKHAGLIRDSIPMKFPIYRQHFSLRPRPKFTGFEKVATEDLELRRKLEARFADSVGTFETTAEDLVLSLSPDPRVFPAPRFWETSF